MWDLSDNAERILRRVYELETKAHEELRKPFIVMTVEEREEAKMHLPMPLYTVCRERARLGDVLTINGIPVIPAELIDLLEEHAVTWDDRDPYYSFFKMPKMDRFARETE